MKPSPAAIAVIKKFEVNYQGVVALEAYDDGYGNWTIGWGRVQDVGRGMKINLAQAEQFLAEDIAIATQAIDRALKVSVTQAQYDALTVLSFNCRSAVKATSSVMQAINAGRTHEVPALWMQYQYARNLKTKAVTQSDGLVRRRRAELELWRGLGEPDRKEAIAVERGTVSNERPGAVRDAVRDSWTIKGALLSAFGFLADKVSQLTDFAGAVHADTMKLKGSADPALALVGMVKGTIPDLAVGFVVAGLGLVIWRRIAAAKEGKIA